MSRSLFLVLGLTAAVAAAAAPRNPLDAVRLEDLSATRARPLFAPTRRPDPPPAAPIAPVAPAPVAATPEPPPFELIGAIVGPHQSYAVMRRPGSEKATRYRLGEDADGWRVGAVGFRSVTLERGGRTKSLALAAPAIGQAPAASATAPASEDSSSTPVAANSWSSLRKARD